MKIPRSLPFAALALALARPAPGAAGEPPPAILWPPQTSVTRPWSYWWWMGSAVDPANVTAELQRYRDAGWGGVHVIPIYGVKGYESRFLPYLGPDWMRMLHHATSEARRLGLDIDMTTGTGWPFGGPDLPPALASSRMLLKSHDAPEGATLALSLPPRRARAPAAQGADGDGKLAPGKGALTELHTLVALSARGRLVDLTDAADESGCLTWTPPSGEGDWKLYSLSRVAPIQKVKRAAPGAEGNVLDPFSPAAMDAYLKRFDAAFDASPGPLPRAQYHDSYEYFGADFTPALLDEFRRLRGYDLRARLPALCDQGDPETIARVKSDYRETMSDLHLAFLRRWTDWAKARGFLTRNQAHGSPGNILDHYAVAEIPETEMYAGDRSMLISKFASSAAHVVGRRLITAETGTWLNQHFHETLGELKLLLDEFFVAGVNHVVFHGTIYSPDAAAWPGWLFYAATQMNPRNPIWRDAPALTAYIARCQSILQSGAPSNEVLVYWPIHDLWHRAEGLLVSNSVHHREWFEQQPIGALAQDLWRSGISFDLVSDRQLASATAGATGVQMPGGRYRAIVVPPCRRIPLATLEQLAKLARDGATILFCDAPPDDVPGLADLARRRAALRDLVAGIAPERSGTPVGSRRIGAGNILVGPCEAALARARIPRETVVDRGFLFVRRRSEQEDHYLLVNRAPERFSGWISLAAPARSVRLLDPLTGRAGVPASKIHPERTEVFLQLDPGHSIFVRLRHAPDQDAPHWAYEQSAGPVTPLAVPWSIRFLEGGPALPPPGDLPAPVSWTTLGPDAERFAGTALYTTRFDAPDAAPGCRWLLDLGTVAQSARVRINGVDLGTLIVAPYHVALPPLRPVGNTLEVEVTNLAANRIRDLDRRKVEWRIFYDINFIGVGGKRWDASAWPVEPSGLIGPVTLQPLRELDPTKATP